LIKNRVLNIRNFGNIVFLIVQDYATTTQVVFDKNIEVKTGDTVVLKRGG